MNTCYLCNKTISTKEYTQADKNGYFYNYYKYKQINQDTLVCEVCHNAWYYLNKPIKELTNGRINE